ncbi:hypothetical protein Slin14017_G064640 [Septoria linicola]|nr:hypothetical protein Slin14017_G064640 [Septoria linicola]
MMESKSRAVQESTGGGRPTLHERLKKLPQEIYDQIYEPTFTTDHIDRDIAHRAVFPSILRVSRETRAIVAGALYGSPLPFYTTAEESGLDTWLRIVPKTYLFMIREIQFERGCKCSGREYDGAWPVLITNGGDSHTFQNAF